ncbi:MAG: nicotinamide mononucleotide transporter family protein, partial [Bacteroidota bacterium]
MVQDIVCYIQTNYFEVLSAIVALICVFLEIKQDILVWWISFVASLMYTWVFYERSLYSSSVLHIFYAIMCIYGWWQWRKIREHTHTKKTVLRMPMHYYPVVLLTIVILTPPVGYVLDGWGEWERPTHPKHTESLSQ